MTTVVGIDIETTGLEQASGARIIEFCAMIYNLETKTLLGKYTQRINPQKPIEPKAQAIHGISFEDVADKPILEDVAPTIVKILNAADIVVAHNGEDFDMPFINNELIRIGVSSKTVPVIDTLKQGMWATCIGKKPNLGELCFACGVDYDTSQAHGAEYDVGVMMDCFFVARDKGFFKLEGEA